MKNINIISKTGEKFTLEVHCEDMSDIDSLLDQLNLSESKIVDEEFIFNDPFKVDLTNHKDQVIGTLIQETIKE